MKSPFLVASQAAFKGTSSLPPLDGKKSVVVALVLGVLFGVIGVGLYTRRWIDTLIALGVLIVGTVFTAGFGAPLAWAFCGVYAAVRVAQSNKMLDEQDKSWPPPPVAQPVTSLFETEAVPVPVQLDGARCGVRVVAR